MSTAAITSKLASQPYTSRTGTAASLTNPQWRFAALLRRVINYGKALIVTVRLRADTPAIARLAKPFGTTDIQRIVARISVAIGMALQLESEAMRQARSGQFLSVMPRGAPAPAAARPGNEFAARRLRERQAGRPKEPAITRPGEGHEERRAARQAKAMAARSQIADPVLALWPTAAQIAVALRGRQISAVLVEICHDLGITPAHPLWPQLSQLIAEYGGNLNDLGPAQQEPDGDGRWCSTRWMNDPGAGPRAAPTGGAAWEHLLLLAAQGTGPPTSVRADT